MLKAIYNSEGVVSDVINYDEVVSQLKKEFELKCIQNSVDDAVINVILKKREEKRTFADLQKIILRKEIEDDFNNQMKLYNEDYIEFIPSRHNFELGEFDEVSTFFEKGEDGKIYQRWTLIKNAKSKITNKIERLKKQLTETDYIVIKSYEAKLSMSDAPYSQDKLDKIIQERQSIRDEINRLEELIK